MQKEIQEEPLTDPWEDFLAMRKPVSKPKTDAKPTVGSEYLYPLNWDFVSRKTIKRARATSTPVGNAASKNKKTPSQTTTSSTTPPFSSYHTDFPPLPTSSSLCSTEIKGEGSGTPPESSQTMELDELFTEEIAKQNKEWLNDCVGVKQESGLQPHLLGHHLYSTTSTSTSSPSERDKVANDPSKTLSTTSSTTSQEDNQEIEVSQKPIKSILKTSIKDPLTREVTTNTAPSTPIQRSTNTPFAVRPSDPRTMVMTPAQFHHMMAPLPGYPAVPMFYQTQWIPLQENQVHHHMTPRLERTQPYGTCREHDYLSSQEWNAIHSSQPQQFPVGLFHISITSIPHSSPSPSPASRPTSRRQPVVTTSMAPSLHSKKQSKFQKSLPTYKLVSYSSSASDEIRVPSTDQMEQR